MPPKIPLMKANGYGILRTKTDNGTSFLSIFGILG
jgi:hypothetical protein